MRGIYDDSFFEFLNKTCDGKNIAQKIVLGTLLGGGVIIAGALAPNIFSAFKPSRTQYQKTYDAQLTPTKIRRSIYHLKKQKYIRVVKKSDGHHTILITAKGKLRVKKILTSDVHITKPKKWDKHWHVITFDIPTEKNANRTAFRRAIKKLNFFQLQKSIWIHPYPCENEILFLAHHHGIQEYIEFFTTKKLLHEKDVRKYYNL